MRRADILSARANSEPRMLPQSVGPEQGHDPHLESEHGPLSSKACKQQSASSTLQCLTSFHENLLRLLVPVGHSVSRAFSNTSCGAPYNLPNPHHLALFTFLARSHATNMRLCPDYPYGLPCFTKQCSGPSPFVSQRLHTLRSFSHALERGSVCK